jgi:hypothetical protein
MSSIGSSRRAHAFSNLRRWFDAMRERLGTVRFSMVVEEEVRSFASCAAPPTISGISLGRSGLRLIVAARSTNAWCCPRRSSIGASLLFRPNPRVHRETSKLFSCRVPFISFERCYGRFGCSAEITQKSLPLRGPPKRSSVAYKGDNHCLGEADRIVWRSFTKVGTCDLFASRQPGDVGGLVIYSGGLVRVVDGYVVEASRTRETRLGPSSA